MTKATASLEKMILEIKKQLEGMAGSHKEMAESHKEIKEQLTRVESNQDLLSGELKAMKGKMSTMQDSIQGVRVHVSKVKEDLTKIQGDVGKINEALKAQEQKMEEALEAQEQKVEEAVRGSADLELRVQNELFDRERKRKEIVLLKVPEPRANTGLARQNLDKETAFEILKKFNQNLKEDDIKFAKRLGRVNPAARDPRRLLIGMHGTHHRDEIISQADKKRNPFVKPSLTQQQRDHVQNLYQQRDQKNNEEKNEEFRWVVRGAPGEELLVRMKKRD